MRCFQKKTFNYYSKAQGQVRVNYRKWLCGETKQKVLGIYTCPHCLDYHTTHRENTMPNSERWHCLDTVLRVKFPRTSELIKSRIKNSTLRSDAPKRAKCNEVEVVKSYRRSNPPEQHA